MTEEVLRKIEERVILVAISMQRQEAETRASIEELEDLVKTAGAITVGVVIQNRDKFHPGTYIGKGKIDEIKQELEEKNATGIICDDELSPAQLRNLESELDTKVIDRTILILDIFAKHAHTKEGKLQVELAQLRFTLSRLSGLGASLSKLGGGIGTRGPGEKKLEMDRRYIRDRISILKDELEEMKRHRDMLREGRKKLGKPMIAIVGYTNAGKSTILNQLTDAGVLQEDKLFATLDPTTRNLSLPDGKEVMLTDTVGFVRKLPHHLIQAFKSTLEEATFADILLHVVDSSSPQAERHIEVVYETLEKLGAGDKLVLTVFNKIDKEGADTSLKDLKAFKTVNMSAISSIGFDQMLKILEDKLQEDKVLIKTIIPYDQGSTLQAIRVYGQILKETYENDGTYIEAYVDSFLLSKYKISDNK
ncbi:MAG: GTPase HflX [Firmicutes bacterium HGW-Firmicutes-7]|nr:MAG: GTPase HflX [Firmicutes bacterium HGW-Firmicutes-7]